MRRLAVVLALALSACLPSRNTECKQELLASAERIRVLEVQNKKLEDQNAEQGRKIDALLAQLVAASDESTRVTLQKRLDAVRADVDRLKKGVRPACTCQPSDPLCSCL
jgi:predicted RNase H-like nuclease (RuvC/YqgF family)